jgi:hypothetical protein
MQSSEDSEQPQHADETVIKLIPFHRITDTPFIEAANSIELTLPATDRLRRPVGGCTTIQTLHNPSIPVQLATIVGRFSKWLSYSIWGEGDRTSHNNQQLHTKLLLGIGGVTLEQQNLFEMFVAGAKINALVSAGLKATDLPILGVGVEEWHSQAGFGAKELAAIDATWPDLLAMGFTTGMMFTRRATFGPHILAVEPFNVTFEILSYDMSETLEELVHVYHASSSDLSLLGVDWRKFVQCGGDRAFVISMEESISGMESNLCAPHGTIENFIHSPNDDSSRNIQSKVSPPTRPVQCKSFVM